MTVAVGHAAGVSNAFALIPLPPADPLSSGLPPLRIPESCGVFQRSGHGLEKQSLFGDAKMQTGAARRRRVYLATPWTATVSLEVSQTALADFVGWFEGPLARGSNFFSAQVVNLGPGLLWYKARIIGASGQAPYATEYLGGVWWRITMKLLLLGEGSTTGPASSALKGAVLFDLLSSAQLTVPQQLSGGVTFALLPVTSAAGGVLSGGARLALLPGTYFPPAPIGNAAGTSTANAVPTTGFPGNAAGTSAALGVAINPAVGSAAGASNAIASAVTQGLTYPDEKGTWVSSAGAITVGINDIPIYFKRNRVLVGVSLVTLGGVGSCGIDIWKVPIGSYPPSSANSICAAAKPAISAGRTYTDTTLTGWTKNFSAGDVAVLHLESNTAFTLIGVKLSFQET